MSSSDYTESGSEYSDSESSSLETDSEDSYIYPWQDAEIDRFSSFDDLSSDDLMQKILDSLPVYDPPQSDSDGNFEYPDPNLYAVADADPSEELKVIDDATPGTQYLPESDDLYLKWIEEFELIQYPDYFADIDEPEVDAKESDALVDISPAIVVPDSPSSTEPAEIDRRRQEAPSVDANDSTLLPSDRPQSARAGRGGQRRSTTRTQEMRRSQSHRQRATSSRVVRGPSTKLDPFAGRKGSARRTHTPDPSDTTEAKSRHAATAPSTPRKQAKSMSPSSRRPPHANTMSASRGRRKRTNDFARQRFKVGKKVKVFGETAVIRFIGEVNDPSLPGEIFGIEFLHETEHGEHNGTLPNGEEIFEVDVPGRGLFVRKKQVKPIRKHARRVARFCGNVQAFERNLLKERFDARRRGRRGKAAKKLGPRDIGRSDYRPEEYELKDDNTSFLAPRGATTKSKSTASVGRARKKQGPRDIGRSDYRPQEFKEGGGRADSMAERGMMSPRGARGSRPPKKLGPREMRKKSNASAKSWKPPDYQIQDSGSFLEERVVRSKSQVKKRVPKKKGPRDYKRNGGSATPTSESPRHINNEHQPRKKRNKSRDRRRRKRRSSSSQAEAGFPRQSSTQSDYGSGDLPPEIEIASGED